MKACGIVAEYHPFHTGHLYQLTQAKQTSQADVMVVAMSGNFVQRGEPAILDKWTRAQMAIRHGADLVLEIPTIGAVQAADYFALASIRILYEAQCESISFGAEINSDKLLEKAFFQWKIVNGSFSSKKEENYHLSYMNKLMDLAQHTFHFEELVQVMSNPNLTLALSYLKAMDTLKYSPNIYPVERIGALHNQLELDEVFASGTALRNVLKNRDWLSYQENLVKFLPSLDLIENWAKNMPFPDWKDYWPYVRYKILSSSIEELQEIYQMEEGIERRLKEMAILFDDFSRFILHTVPKTWTKSRLRRLCMYIFLGIKKEDCYTFFNKPTKIIQVLGFSSIGQQYLKELKSITPVLFATNYARVKGQFEHQYLQDSLYTLPYSGKFYNQNEKRVPIRKNSLN